HAHSETYTRSLHDALPISRTLRNLINPTPCRASDRRIQAPQRDHHRRTDRVLPDPDISCAIDTRGSDGCARSKTVVRSHGAISRSEEHTSELQSPYEIVCR